jgi:hypothetical protein
VRRHHITTHTRFWNLRFFGVFINGFNDGQQDFQFFVNAADKVIITTDSNGEDYSWDCLEKQSRHY